MKSKLDRDQKRILSILSTYNICWDLDEIDRMLWAMTSVEKLDSQEISDLINMDHELDWRLISDTMEDTEQRVKELISLGLLRKGIVKRGKEVVFDNCFIATKEGEEVGRRLRKGRQIILRPPVRQRRKIFIACAIGHDDVEELCEQVFEPTCSSLKLQAIRIDQREPSGTISGAILDEIEEVVCVIADLTYARQSVYFEVGFAQGLGVPILLTCRKDHQRGICDEERVHFDIAQYKISFWEMNTNQKFRWPKSMDPKYRLSLILSKKRRL